MSKETKNVFMQFHMTTYLIQIFNVYVQKFLLQRNRIDFAFGVYWLHGFHAVIGDPNEVLSVLCMRKEDGVDLKNGRKEETRNGNIVHESRSSDWSHYFWLKIKNLDL